VSRATTASSDAMTRETSVDARAMVHYTRLAMAFVATGGFTLFGVGRIFLLPFALSPYAIQNDVYMGNLFLGYPLPALGFASTVVGLLILILVPRLRHQSGGMASEQHLWQR
jgi:hypothetical protein